MQLPGRIGLLGAGGQAREISSYLPAGTRIFWAVSASHLHTGSGLIDVGAPSPTDRDTAVVGAVGAPGLRRALVSAWPGDRFASVIADAAHVGTSCVLGPGVVVAPGAILTVDVTIGAHTQVNVGATVSHDAHLGAFVTVAPGAHIGGGVTIGDGAVIGIGATVAPRVAIAPGVVVGAGATVIADVPVPNSVVVGSPARTIRVEAGWLDVF